MGTSFTDYRAQVWDAFTLSPISTSSVRVTITTVYNADNNGFIEVEFLSSGDEHFLDTMDSVKKALSDFSETTEKLYVLAMGLVSESRTHHDLYIYTICQ